MSLNTNPSTLDLLASSILSRTCSRPQRVDDFWVRCSSGDPTKCRSCARLFRDDWRSIGLSGYSTERRYLWVTLTIGTFGPIHHVPAGRASTPRRCACGVYHRTTDEGLRGVPVEPATYDYEGQLHANRDAAKPWNNSLAKLHRGFSFQHLVAKEVQARGAIHFHVVVALERTEDWVTANFVLGLLEGVTSNSSVTGEIQGWGNVDVKELVNTVDQPEDATVPTVIGYAIKSVITYALKGQASGAADMNSKEQRLHRKTLDTHARRISCSPQCPIETCQARVHGSLLIRRQPVSVSRNWSIGDRVTRGSLRDARTKWVRENAESAGSPMTEETADRSIWARKWEVARASFPDDATRWPSLYDFFLA